MNRRIATPADYRGDGTWADLPAYLAYWSPIMRARAAEKTEREREAFLRAVARREISRDDLVVAA